MSHQSLLDKLYQKDSAVTSMEKTAEDALSAALRGENQVSENPYESMSTSDLADLAKRLEENASSRLSQTEVEKIAMDTVGGEVMAHALVHELSLIKEAGVAGVCRVCKDNPRDLEGQSICSACQSAE